MPIPRFTRIPLTLYRIQAQPSVRLRDYETQVTKGRTSFDLKTHDGLVQPLPPNSEFNTPNGMSLRPAGPNMFSILNKFRGEPKIFTFRCGLELPSGLCVYHEHSDHYSLQTTKPIPLNDFNQILTDFLSTLPVQSKQQFIEQQEDLDDQDN
jgi:hypothetical protein